MFGVVRSAKCNGYRFSNQNLGGWNVGPDAYNAINIIVDCYGATVSKDGKS